MFVPKPDASLFQVLGGRIEVSRLSFQSQLTIQAGAFLGALRAPLSAWAGKCLFEIRHYRHSQHRNLQDVYDYQAGL